MTPNDSHRASLVPNHYPKRAAAYIEFKRRLRALAEGRAADSGGGAGHDARPPSAVRGARVLELVGLGLGNFVICQNRSEISAKFRIN